MKTKDKNFIENLRDAWKKIRKPASYVIALAVFTLCIVPDKGFKFIAAAALGTIILSIIFEIHEKIVPQKQTIYEKGLAEATEDIEKFVKKYSGDKRNIHIQYIGMTMYNAWNTMETVFNSLKKGGIKNIHFEVAMLTPEWLELNKIRKGWTPDSAKNNSMRIKIFFDASQAHINELNWTESIHFYAHMPCLHGILINESVLICEDSRWENDEMKAGDHPMRLYQKDDAFGGDDKIKVFVGWFNYCKSKSQALIQWPSV